MKGGKLESNGMQSFATDLKDTNPILKTIISGNSGKYLLIVAPEEPCKTRSSVLGDKYFAIVTNFDFIL